MHRERLPAVDVAAILLILTSLCSSQGQPGTPKPAETKITGVRFVAFPKSNTDGSVTFRLAIEGVGLPPTKNGVTVLFETKDPALPVTCASATCVPLASSDKEVVVEGTAKAKTEITHITVVPDKGVPIDTKAFTISITENPSAPKLEEFTVKLEHEKNKEFPNLHSLVVTKESGGADVGFADNPHWMTVDLMPSGATDVHIVQTNRQQLDLHFVAAADYVPTSVVVTVYTGSDLETRQVKAVAKKAPADPDEPKVTGTETVFINRSHGVGRIRIFGKGFGDYEPPPYPVDDYLWNCLQEFHIRGTVRSADWVQAWELEDLDSRLEACRQTLNGEFENLPDRNVLKTRLNYAKINLASFVKVKPPQKHPEKWAQEIRDKVTVSVNPRNPDIQVEKVEILDINDEMIDVYFEFTRSRGYAWPFRLADGTLVMRKTVQKTTQTVKNDKLTGMVTGSKEQTYGVPYHIGPKRDPNLTYQYTVLDQKSANTLLGKGVADNFYVLQLSVVNNGEKKVAVPLSAIQAEVEWIRGTDKKIATVSFVAGPPTLAPIPLAAVSGYFDAYQKVKGFRAHLLNGLDAATVMATALVPFTGPSFKDAEVFFSGGFVPGVRKALGDLSGQQLQNLTSLSWESSETLPAKGGSMEKLIYIQRREQFASKAVRVAGVTAETRKQIASIMDLEITGFEVIESAAKEASPAPATGKTTTPSQTAAPSPTPTAPATPAPK